MNTRSNTPRQSGSSMIEVLITLVILLVGLLGLAGVMTQSQRSEMESYQRVQALVLLRDMAGRINANRNVASCYAFTNAANGTPYVGFNSTYTPACTTGTAAQNAQAIQDMTDWDTQLTGAAETTSGGGNAGAMVGARGCVSYDSATELNDSTGTAISGSGIYTVSVAWQGMGKTFANTSLLCGQNLYGNEAQRRVVSLTLRIGAINNTL
jgi:type IV pilus assembly protein PilV